MCRTGGRAGSRGSARPRTRPRCSDAAKPPPDGDELFDEAADAVEVVRRLWDSWEDDAIIRDAATGRYIDRDKLHYIDFHGKYFSVKGPSITPRPPQGQPVVAALAHAPRIYEFAAASADLVFITPTDDASLDTILDEIEAAGGQHLKVYADVVVTFGGDIDFGSDALIFGGSRSRPRRPAVGLATARRRRRAAAAGRQRHRSAGDRRRGGATAAAGRAVSHLLPRRRDAAATTRPARRTQPVCEGEPVTTVPLSILDLSPISAGSDAATALHNTIDLAQHAEHWGYRRFWIAEHHFVGVASSAPAVLIGQIAAATNTIQVGAAAVQLGHTTAAAVVESFGMLAAFYPGRIDLGVGRRAAARHRLQAQIDRRPSTDRRGNGAKSTGW